MTMVADGLRRHSDYSLVGECTADAIAKGLADAQWYAPNVPKEAMRALLERRDGPAVRDTLIWFGLLFAFGIAGIALWGTAWAIIPFALYAVIYASSSDSRWHETGHGTAFKSDWLNNTVYEIASFMIMRESTLWRWSHTRHHSDTLIVGLDPEIGFQRPVDILISLLKFVGVPAMYRHFRSLLLHATGRMTPAERTFVPATEFSKIYWRARIYLLIYASVVGLALSLHSILPFFFIGLPTLCGSWLILAYSITQHAGLAENVLDHRLNSRTVYMNRLNRYLYWNMGYHIEHHIFPMVPYYNLPKLHALIRSEMPPVYDGLFKAYREIIPALLRQSKESNYFIRRPVPPSAMRTETTHTVETIVSSHSPDSAGWVEVCDQSQLIPGDILRFDHADDTYAVYRTAFGQLFATSGTCTHGKTHLAGGFLQSTCIECPKHNGRFDIRDGSVLRAPPRHPLKIYSVREKDGKILLNVSQVGISALPTLM
jgi:MocE subfamily Rieske [2Fe-2S] domain protein